MRAAPTRWSAFWPTENWIGLIAPIKSARALLHSKQMLPRTYAIQVISFICNNIQILMIRYNFRRKKHSHTFPRGLHFCCYICFVINTICIYMISNVEAYIFSHFKCVIKSLKFQTIII